MPGARLQNSGWVESPGARVDAPGPPTVTSLVTPRVVFQIPFALTLCDLEGNRLYMEGSRDRSCDPLRAEVGASDPKL